MRSEIPENDNEVVSATRKNDVDMIDVIPSEPIQRTPEEIEEKRRILEQVEYYLGDKNFPKDKFLKELCSKDPKGLRLFKKMQVYKNDALIVEALRESPEILEVDDSGFDTVNQPSQESVANFFKTYGKVVQIKPRMDTDQKFKGSYFIQFETHKVAKSISKKELFDYCEMKCDVKGLDRDTMRKLPPQIKKEANPRSNPKLEPVTYKKNCLLRFEGAGPNISWKDIKAKMKEDYGKVMFVKLDKQPRGGIIEFGDPIALQVSSAILNSNLDFDGIKPVFTVLQGEDEKNFYLYKRRFKEEKRKKSKNKHIKKNNVQRKVEVGNKNKRKKSKNKHTKRNNVQRKVKGKNDAGIADCSSTSVVGNKNKLDDTTEVEKSSASKPKPEEIVFGNKHKHDTTEVEMSPEIKPKLEEAVVGNKRTEVEKSPAIKSKLEETVIGNKRKHDTTETEMSPEIKLKLEETVMGNKRRPDDTIEAEMSPAVKPKLEETVIGNKRKLDTTEAEMSPAFKLKLEEIVIGNKRKLDATEAEK
ncbi:hypothetical protein C2G38_2151873 [Gigaspora rosea]|uniref:HTH La-type RNA-binding domain-containing protein n=1 Tax=Gigaspora rosea TaxID=44941 RepID=A0A397W7R7_9GLOM|nr:hypothetical protein C2G38_2151873 [Gigaspora rosea]